MANAVMVDVAEAVKTMLSAASLSQTFTLERSYADWDLELQPTDGLRVDVATVSTKQEANHDTREPSLHYIVQVDVAIRRKFGPEHYSGTGRVPNAQIDPLILLVQEIHALFVQHRFSGNDGAIAWEKSPQLMALPVIKHLRELKQFTAIIRLTFRATP